METNITINAIELASNLAHEKLMQYYEDTYFVEEDFFCNL